MLLAIDIGNTEITAGLYVADTLSAHWRMTTNPDRTSDDRADVIVLDFGTATTFDCITADGRFIGGSIMPGLRTSAEQLTRRAAKLPATELTRPDRVIGRRTEECIRGGVLYGAADAVDGMVRRI